ncbi:hypothetical protein J1N35_042867 [Gossypium stocksii]|uniref:RNase H type-1 domain-containing protein n=1 Tax=Gossypium stocksii TaxID=47602 RepID=A0A9D3U6B0_9ROSI|nr:hypothetical protein J1N35_042867 [Gossypium stocksii]
MDRGLRHTKRIKELDTDAAVDRGIGAESAGGVMLDYNRIWIFGYNRFIGKCNIFEVELWDILTGMITLLNNSFNKVVIHIDYLEVVQVL